MKSNLFVCGTLMIPELLYALTKKRFKMVDAVLEDHKRLRIRKKSYPALIPSKGDSVQGKLIFDLEEDDLKILDFYEDDEYIRKEIEIADQTADVYIYNASREVLKERDWSEVYFRLKHLDFHLRVIIPEIMEEYNEYFE